MNQAIVDKQNADTVLDYKWFKNNTGEPCTIRDGKYTTMAAMLCEHVDKDDIIEHINGNKLDCRTSNLRAVASSDLKRVGKIENRGVRRVHTRNGDKYMVYSCIAGSYIHVGTYLDLETAVNSHDATLRELMGNSAPFLKITDWSRVENIPIVEKYVVDDWHKDNKRRAKEEAKRAKKGGKAPKREKRERQIVKVDKIAWMQCTGYMPGAEPEGEAMFPDPHPITIEEIRVMQLSSLGDGDYWHDMAAWWRETGSTWDIDTGKAKN